MSEYRVATRYAKSLLTLAHQKGVLEEIHDDMQLFAKICSQNRDFTVMLKNPIIKNHIKSKILKTLFKSKVHEMTLLFFDIVTRKNREKYLQGITEEFHVQYNALHEIGMAKVTTFFALEDDLRHDFKQLIGQFIGKEQVELEVETNQDLIGGYILRFEGKQVDESLRGKLKELKLKFS